MDYNSFKLLVFVPNVYKYKFTGKPSNSETVEKNRAAILDSWKGIAQY